MASRAFWSADDLAVLDQHIDKPDWLTAVKDRFRDRTVKALKVRMAKRRGELGLGDGRNERGGHDDQDVFNANAVVASQALLAAIERAGVRP